MLHKKAVAFVLVVVMSGDGRRVELWEFAKDFFILGELYPEMSLQGSRNISGLRGLDISRIAPR